MSMSIMLDQCDRYCVELAYPAPMFEELDGLLNRLADNFGGAWTNSGTGLVKGMAERDLEFTFDDEEQARDFARKATFIIAVQVKSIQPSR